MHIDFVNAISAVSSDGPDVEPEEGLGMIEAWLRLTDRAPKVPGR